MKNALLFHETGVVEKVSIDPSNQLKEMQTYVGGLIQVIPTPFDNKMSLFVNEEGKFVEDHGVNIVATAVFGAYLGDGDYFAGDVLIMGPVDTKGETLGLSDAACTNIINVLKKAGLPT